MMPRSFAPDLVIEVTRACDRACVGCYAPNILLKKTSTAKSDGLFLSREALQAALETLRERPNLVAVRGGEPSLHEDLQALLSLMKQHCNQVTLETHGRWLLDETSRLSLAELSRLGITVKVSFDRMHALSTTSLKRMISRLDESNVTYLVAITEATEEAFECVASSIAAFVDRSRLIFQKKADNSSQLLKPRIGVIDTAGKLSLSLTAKTQAFAPNAIRRFAL